MSRDDAIILDIVQACRLIQEFRGAIDKEEFLRDRKTQAAILHELLVIGEAVKRLSAGFREAHPSLPWRQIAGMRDRVIHDRDGFYVWADAFSVFIDRLNNRCNDDEAVDCTAGGDADCSGVGGPCGFAGHRDWRMPNVKELQSIVNYEILYPAPAVDPVFDSGCTPGCTVTTCSCTQASVYWSSTTLSGDPNFAWYVYFAAGYVGSGGKGTDGDYVRAVRGGL